MDSDIKIDGDVLGVDRGGFCMVDGDDLVLGDIVLRARSDLQNVVMRHGFFGFSFAISMHRILTAHVGVTRDQQMVGKRANCWT